MPLPLSDLSDADLEELDSIIERTENKTTPETPVSTDPNPEADAPPPSDQLKEPADMLHKVEL
jgi:hypothetical protein